MKNTEHRELLLKVASGDESALGEFYAAHAQVLYNFAVRILRSADDAAEAVSDLFLSIWSGAAAARDILVPADALLVCRMREILLAKTAAKSSGGGRRNPVREVDLWALVSQAGSPARSPAVEGARDALGMSGAVSTSVLSLVYFGGWSIPDAAERFSMTPGECRSRLHGCLATLSARLAGKRPGSAHGGRLSVCSAARALGALPRGEDPEYDSHLESGCSECREEASRFISAAAVLPGLLPNVALPPELLEKIFFSIRLARLASPAADAVSHNVPHDVSIAAGEIHTTPAIEPPAHAAHAVDDGAPADPLREQSPGAVRGRSRMPLALAAVAGFGAALFLGFRLLSAQIELEDQSVLIESLQERHTDLMMKYDRLAGISGFFETKGVVTLLKGTEPYAGLSGKIVWDTGGRSAMLQIIDPPAALDDAQILVKAVGGNSALRIAEFRSDEHDRGKTLYRFFPIDVAPGFPAEGFAVDAIIPDRQADPAPNATGGTAESRGAAIAYRPILMGSIPDSR